MEGPALRRFLRLPWANLARLRRPLVRCVRVRARIGRAGTRRFTVRPTNGDLSMGGVFIDGRTLPVGTLVEITLECRTPICAKGIVRFIERGLVPRRSRRKHRGKALPAEARKAKVGMGIEFTELSARDLKRLEELIARFPWP